MAVNGVEIIEGSEWFTKDGARGVIKASSKERPDMWPWELVMDNGRSYTYTREGLWFKGQENNKDLSHPVRHTSPKTALTLLEITAHKQELQRKIATFLHNELTAFQSENLVSISNVNLEFTTTNLVDSHPRLVLHRVDIEIKI